MVLCQSSLVPISHVSSIKLNYLPSQSGQADKEQFLGVLLGWGSRVTFNDCMFSGANQPGLNPAETQGAGPVADQQFSDLSLVVSSNHQMMFFRCPKRAQSSLMSRSGMPNLWDLMPVDLRWSWCKNRNKMYREHNVLKSSWNHSPSPTLCKNCLLPWNWSLMPRKSGNGWFRLSASGLLFFSRSVMSNFL